MKSVAREEELGLDLDSWAGSGVGPVHVEGNPSENPESLAGEEKSPQEAEKKKEVDRQVLLADGEEQEGEKQGETHWKVQVEQEQTGEGQGMELREVRYS